MTSLAAPTRTTRVALLFALSGLVTFFVVMPHGDTAAAGESRFDPVTKEHTFEHDQGRMIYRGIANSAGGYAVILTLLSLALPYLKRPMLTRWHARIGIAVLALASIHTAMFLWEGSMRGWAPGVLSLSAFAFHGVTGAWKAAFARAWGAAWWRFAHRGSGWIALLMVAEHIALASWHFGLARWFEEGRW